MKKPWIKFYVFIIIMIIAGIYINNSKAKSNCTKIKDGIIYDRQGNIITLGYDQYGYNYQVHSFKGLYDNYSRPAIPTATGPFLKMKWNDIWLSNMDCDGDAKLDYSCCGGGAWLTNAIEGMDDNGQYYKYFVKIVSVPLDALAINDVWYNADGSEIGPAIWSSFAIVEEITEGLGTLNYMPVSPRWEWEDQI